MKKIPTLFKRDPATKLRYVTSEVNPAAQWVADGEGVPTRKYDGTCCLVRDGALFKRHEVKPGKQAPANFEAADYDEVTGKTVGWVPVGDGPEDKWHREAWQDGRYSLGDGTYELVGPKVQGNPEGYERHVLIRHADAEVLPADTPRDYDGLREMMRDFDYEGLVWHHPDGRMAKIKRRDFPS